MVTGQDAKITDLNNQIKVKNSELNQFNGIIQAIAINQIKNVSHKNGKTFIKPQSFIYSGVQVLSIIHQASKNINHLKIVWFNEW